MKQYEVVFYPKTDLEKVQDIREKYDPQFPVIPPHITLVSPFSDIPEEKIVEHLSEVIKNIKCFEVRLNGLTKSIDDYLFLLVQEGKEEIQKIHEKLYSEVLAQKLSSDIPFIPHITLGDFTKKKDLYEQALAKAKSLNIDIRCAFDSITLIEGDGVNPAKTIKNVLLKI